MKMNYDPSKLEVRIPFQDSTITVALAIFRDGEKLVVGRGIARRSYLDSPNPELGKTIASGRAVRAVTDKLDGKIVRHHFMG